MVFGVDLTGEYGETGSDLLRGHFVLPGQITGVISAITGMVKAKYCLLLSNSG